MQSGFQDRAFLLLKWPSDQMGNKFASSVCFLGKKFRTNRLRHLRELKPKGLGGDGTVDAPDEVFRLLAPARVALQIAIGKE